MEGEKISHAHVLVHVCKRINVCMNLSVHACVCPFLTWSVLHFKIRVANDPRLTQSPAERGRVIEGGLSLRAHQYHSKCLALCVRTYVKHAWAYACVCVGVSCALIQSVSATCLIYVCAHVQKGPPSGQRQWSTRGRELLSGTSVYGTCPVGKKQRVGREVIQGSRAKERRADTTEPAGASYFYISQTPSENKWISNLGSLFLLQSPLSWQTKNRNTAKNSINSPFELLSATVLTPQTETAK